MLALTCAFKKAAKKREKLYKFLISAIKQENKRVIHAT